MGGDGEGNGGGGGGVLFSVGDEISRYIANSPFNGGVWIYCGTSSGKNDTFAFAWFSLI